MCVKRFISKNWLMMFWDLAGWMWNQKGRPAGWNLRQELTLISWGRISSSFRKPQVLFSGLCLTWWGHHSVKGDLLYLSSDDRYEPHPQNTFTATSRWVLVESLETVLAKLTQKTDHHSTCQDFSFEKSQHLYCYYCILRFTWICIEIYYMWEQSFLGKRGYVLKI